MLSYFTNIEENNLPDILHGLADCWKQQNVPDILHGLADCWKQHI